MRMRASRGARQSEFIGRDRVTSELLTVQLWEGTPVFLLKKAAVTVPFVVFAIYSELSSGLNSTVVEANSRPRW